MNEIIYVNTGEVKLGREGTLLNSGAIGSCVVVCMYNSLNKSGVMAHIMLPGAAPAGQEENMKYASNAIQKLLELINMDSTDPKNFGAFILGGANVLKRPNDAICENNIRSVEKLLDENEIKILGKAVGGYQRRAVIFDIKNASINFTEGDSKPKILGKWKSELN